MNRSIRAAAAALAVSIALSACGDAEPPPAPDSAAQPATQAVQQAARQQEAEPSAAAQQEQPDAGDAEVVEAPAQSVQQRESAQQSDEAQPGQGDMPEQQQPRADGSGNVELAWAPALNGVVFEQPTEMIVRADGSVLIAEQRGSISRFLISGDETQQFGFLDLTDQVTFSGERGLLSVALHPDQDAQPYVFVYYSPADATVTRLSRFHLSANGAAADAGSELVILEVPQPYTNHNGGAVRFGPDGMLYLGIGDGGAANDPLGHGQNRETLLGTIIRIDIDDIDTATPYRIPPDNPFLGIAGVRPEIWAYGLRNPWRMAFDSLSGDLYVADVGQDRWEEVAIVRAGENHGWNVYEGDECFRSQDACDQLTNHTRPIAVIPHPDGCSITGGMVYRGAAIPELVGHYVFADYCSFRLWTIAPAGQLTERMPVDVSIISFATDQAGEIYALTPRGPILRLIAAR